MRTIILALLISIPLFFLGGCLLEEILLPAIPGEGDTVDTTENPIDTTISLPLVCDTVVVTQPEFITIYNEYFKGLPADSTYYFHKPQGLDIPYPSLRELLKAQGYLDSNIQVFAKDNSVAAIIKGTNIKSNLESRIWTRDAIGQKAIFKIGIQSFQVGGALEFEEFKQVAIDFPSVRSFNFRNTQWTQAQYEEIALIILGECKLGRNDANFGFNLFPVSDSLYCQFFVRDWDVVRGQPNNCNLP